MNTIFTGCRLSPKDKRDLKGEMVLAQTPITELPKYVFNPTIISFQDGVGACTGYSGATLKTGLEYQETGKLEKLSGRWVYAFNKLNDNIPEEGSYSRQTMATLKNYGVPKETLCPNEPFIKWQYYKNVDDFKVEALNDAEIKKTEGYSSVSLGLILDFINKYSFLIMSVPWNAGDHNPVNNVMTGKGESYGYHSIASCGYISAKSDADANILLKQLVDAQRTQKAAGFIDPSDRIYLIMPNSFAEGWGYKGFALMPFAPMEIRHEFNEAWAVVSDLPNDWKNPPASPTIRYGKPRTWKSFLYEQQCAFNIWLRNKIKRLPTNLEICKLAYGFWDWFSVYDKTRLEYGYTNWLTKDQWLSLKSEATGNVGKDIITWRLANKI